MYLLLKDLILLTYLLDLFIIDFICFSLIRWFTYEKR